VYSHYFIVIISFFSLVRISENVGKLDLLLTKTTEGKEWKAIGQPLDGNGSLKTHNSRGKKSKIKKKIIIIIIINK